MIKHKNEMPISPRTNVKGGNGTYESMSLFSAQELDKTTLFAINTMPSGASIGVHPHTAEGEAYVILAGEAVVQEDGTDYVLLPGDAEYCTGGHTHGIANRSDTPLKFLAIIIK
jgi:uncharacterized cupin superfamily protein